MSGMGSGMGSAEGALHSALLGALKGADGLAALNGVYAGPAVKATPPYAELGELLSIDWSTKDAAGRELRPAVTIRDTGETPARVHDLAGAAGAAIEGVARDLGGWRVASLAFVRTRVVRDGPGKWAALVEYRVRMLAA